MSLKVDEVLYHEKSQYQVRSEIRSRYFTRFNQSQNLFNNVNNL